VQVNNNLNPEKDITERALSGFVWMITGSGIQVILKITVLGVLSRLISPDDFGLISIAIIAVEFSKMFTHMGVGPAIVQRKILEDRHINTGFTLSLLTGLLFAVALILCAPALSRFFHMDKLIPILKTTALIFLVDSFTLIGQALMQRNMKFKLITTIEFISYAVGYGGVGILLGYFGWGVWALVMANLSQAFLNALIVNILQPFSKKLGFEYKAFKELLLFGGGMTLARIANYLAVQGDNLVVGRMMGAGALGIYGRAYQFMAMPAGLFGNSLDRVLFPAMAKIQDNKTKLGKAYLTGTSLIALISISVSIQLIFLAPEIIQFLLGSKWNAVVLPFQVLACSLVFRMNYKMSDSLARATGAVYRRAWRQLIYALLVIAGSYFGHFFGLYGVAVGVAFALVMNFLLMSHLSIQLTEINWFDIIKAHWNGIKLGVVTGISTYLLVMICRNYLNSTMLTIIFTVGGSLAFVGFIIWQVPTYFIRNDEMILLKKPVFKRFKKMNLQPL
jgi:PST family polysaccharide transporter